MFESDNYIVKKMKKSVIASLAILMLVASLMTGTPGQTVYGTQVQCRTPQECRELQERSRENLAEIDAELEVYEADLEYVQDRLDIKRAAVDASERALEQLANTISELQTQIKENGAILEQTEEDIEAVIDRVANSMRLSQRRTHTASGLVDVMNESASLTDLVRSARVFNRMAEEDYTAVDKLAVLLERQTTLIATLYDQATTLTEKQREEETRRTALALQQEELMEEERRLMDQVYALGQRRMTEEESLQLVTDIEAVLLATPAPPASSAGSPINVGAVTPRGMVNPLSGSIVTSHFGPRWGTHHGGIDLYVRGNRAAPIVAAAAGVVTAVRYGRGGFGHYIIISHSIDGQRIDTMYAHLRYRSPIPVGTVVGQGEWIGTKGSTGFSTGPHLHFEVHIGPFSYNRGVDPRHWIGF